MTRYSTTSTGEQSCPACAAAGAETPVPYGEPVGIDDGCTELLVGPLCPMCAEQTCSHCGRAGLGAHGGPGGEERCGEPHAEECEGRAAHPSYMADPVGCSCSECAAAR